MVETLKIAKARPEDVPALVQLVNSAYRGDSSRQGWTTEADLLDGIRTDEAAVLQMIQQRDSVILKCIDDHKIVGCVHLQKNGERLYLGMLSVDPALQAKGIGKFLLQAAETQAKKEGCSVIEMTVLSVRSELINWYQRHGYQSTGLRENFPDDPRFGIPKQPLQFIKFAKQVS